MVIPTENICSFHGKELVTKGSYVCFECGHVWRTAGEIVEEHLKFMKDLEPSDSGYNAKECALRFCPLCLHDWLPR